MGKGCRAGKARRSEKANPGASGRESRRELCVGLLHLAPDFRVLMENAYDSRGPVQDPNIKQVRESAAHIASQADKVEFNVPKAGTAAVALADRPEGSAMSAQEKNREHGFQVTH